MDSIRENERRTHPPRLPRLQKRNLARNGIVRFRAFKPASLFIHTHCVQSDNDRENGNGTRLLFSAVFLTCARVQRWGKKSGGPI